MDRPRLCRTFLAEIKIYDFFEKSFVLLDC